MAQYHPHMTGERSALVTRVCKAVDAAPDERWSIARMARAGGGSVAQVQRAFREKLGVSPRDFATACRQRAFRGALRAGVPVTRAMYDAGYGSSSRVYGSLHLSAMTPATYGRGGEGASIDWLTVKSSLGWILVASTRRGVCFVELGPRVADLLATLRAEFPLATIAPKRAPALRRLAAAARAAAEARPWPPDIPVDILGTAFQWRVWRALTKIPIGETRSYSEVARTIGAPRAVRAVARACATNPIALLVPCHRVVGSSGELRGYRWGLEVKRGILSRERR